MFWFLLGMCISGCPAGPRGKEEPRLAHAFRDPMPTGHCDAGGEGDPLGRGVSLRAVSRLSSQATWKQPWALWQSLVVSPLDSGLPSWACGDTGCVRNKIEALPPSWGASQPGLSCFPPAGLSGHLLLKVLLMTAGDGSQGWRPSPARPADLAELREQPAL